MRRSIHRSHFVRLRLFERAPSERTVTSAATRKQVRSKTPRQTAMAVHAVLRACGEGWTRGTIVTHELLGSVSYRKLRLRFYSGGCAQKPCVWCAGWLPCIVHVTSFAQHRECHRLRRLCLVRIFSNHTKAAQKTD